jgi:RNA polymerase sigma-70 factor (ECF subfamily)
MDMIDYTAPPPFAEAELYRPRLFGIAYRMLGDVHEAEDLVQETLFRWHQADRAAIASPEAWLVAVITRLAIDRSRRAETERLQYVGTWLPEPLATSADAADRHAELASDLSVAFLVLLERLAPEERAAFLLREVFDVGYDEIARVLDKNEAAVRQIVHRAKTRVRDGRPRFSPDPETQRALLERFLGALAADDKDAMLALFASDATFTSDGGGKVRAARNVLGGPERIARFLLGLHRKHGHLVRHDIVELNGQPAIVTYHNGVIAATTSFETEGTRILAVYRVLNPDKLRHLNLSSRAERRI